MPVRTAIQLSDFAPNLELGSADRKRTTVSWPEPVFGQLDLLVAAAKANTDRQELAAALICASRPERDVLVAALEILRAGKVRDLG
jgi:hypothetical protein